MSKNHTAKENSPKIDGKSIPEVVAFAAAAGTVIIATGYIVEKTEIIADKLADDIQRGRQERSSNKNNSDKAPGESTK